MRSLAFVILLSIAAGFTSLLATSLIRDETQYDAGKREYKNYCANCHLENGRGFDKVYPSLVASVWVTGSEDRLIAFLLFGSKATVSYIHKQGIPECLAWRNTFTDRKAASILTYIRAAWGNQAPPVSNEAVGQIRKSRLDVKPNPTLQLTAPTPHSPSHASSRSSS